MSHIYQSSFLEALGWSLLDSLWQMGSLWIVYILLTLNGKKFSASVRHSLSLLALAGGTAWFVLTLGLNYYNAINDQALYSLSWFFKDGIGNALDNWRYLDSAIPALSFLYLISVGAYSLILLFRLWLSKTRLGNSFRPVPQQIKERLQDIYDAVGVSKKVAVWLSEKAMTPMTIGFFKPLILLPVAAVNNLSLSQLEAVIAHELFHIKRNDYLVNLFVSFAGVLLFFNPFARIITGIIKKERENSCDDEVLAMGFNAWDYSQALYLLGRNHPDQNNLVIAATGPGKKILLHRIRRMLKNEASRPSVMKPLLTFFLCLTVAFFGNQQPDTPVLPSSNATATLDVPVKLNNSGSNAPPAGVYITETVVVLSPPPVVERKQEKKVEEEREIKPEPIAKAEQKAPVQPVIPKPPKPARVVINFVSAPRVVEFTFIERPTPEAPKPVSSDRPLPYVPESTFYFPVDSTRSTISL
jgi:beta-lactamase regulating signal transducer with metallopeptidase domain